MLRLERVTDFYGWLWKDLSGFGKCFMFGISWWLFPVIWFVAVCIEGDQVRSYEAIEDEVVQRRCRLCGCTDRQACPGGCCWVEPDLCSRCVEV